MKTKVKDLTVDELKRLIEDTMKEKYVGAYRDTPLLEDIIASSSKEYLKSIRRARKQYKEGKVKPFDLLENIHDIIVVESRKDEPRKETK